MEILLIINIFFVILLFGLAYVSLRYFINQIEKYPKVTLEEIYNSKKMRQKYNIENISNPRDYGFEYKELNFKSGKLNLYGWFIENKEAEETMIIVHGRSANRLTVLSYLEMFKKSGLYKKYSFFIPDMRNSGKSDKSRTKLGYLFAQDIINGLEFLNKKYKKKKFVLYGFSQGGMACAIVSKFHARHLKKKGIKIEKMILDSPLANVKKKVKNDANNRKVPKIIRSITLRIFNLRVGGNLEKLRLSYLLKRVPTLILQSKNDKMTTYGILMEEYNDISHIPNVIIKIFEKGSHTRIYFENECRDVYENTVVDFLK